MEQCWAARKKDENIIHVAEMRMLRCKTRSEIDHTRGCQSMPNVDIPETHQEKRRQPIKKNDGVGCKQTVLEDDAGLETNTRPRRVKFRPGEWFVRPDQPGGRVDFLLLFLGLQCTIIII